MQSYINRISTDSIKFYGFVIINMKIRDIIKTFRVFLSECKINIYSFLSNALYFINHEHLVILIKKRAIERKKNNEANTEINKSEKKIGL